MSEYGNTITVLLAEADKLRLDRDAWRFTAKAESAAVDAAEAEQAYLLDALREIAKGEGPFSADPLTHAANTIEAMKAIALTAIARAEAAK